MVVLSTREVKPGRKKEVSDEAKANDEEDEAHYVPVVFAGADFEEAEDELYLGMLWVVSFLVFLCK